MHLINQDHQVVANEHAWRFVYQSTGRLRISRLPRNRETGKNAYKPPGAIYRRVMRVRCLTFELEKPKRLLNDPIFLEQSATLSFISEQSAMLWFISQGGTRVRDVWHVLKLNCL